MIHGDELVGFIMIIVWYQIQKLLNLLKRLWGRRLHYFNNSLVYARLNQLEPYFVRRWAELCFFEFF